MRVEHVFIFGNISSGFLEPGTSGLFHICKIFKLYDKFFVDWLGFLYLSLILLNLVSDIDFSSSCIPNISCSQLNIGTVKRQSPVHKAPCFARVGGGLFIICSLPLTFCKEAVFMTRIHDLPVTKEQP